MMRPNRLGVVAFVLSTFMIPVMAAWCAGDAGEVTVDEMGSERVTLSVKVGEYSVVRGAEGQRIEMPGCGYLGDPGAPMLPVMRFLVALPPASRAGQVEVLSCCTRELPGTYTIDGFPSPVLLPGVSGYHDAMRRLRNEYQATWNAIYLKDLPFPEKVVRLSARGTLRKYSYAAVAFCPFTYYPLSGRLEYHSEVEIAIHLDCRQPGMSEAGLPGDLMRDQVADRRAASIFCNYHQVSDLYQPRGPQEAPLTDTYDFIVITTGDLEGAVQASGFTTWKTALGHRVRTVLTTDSEIAGQPGGDLAERIRNFLRSYYATWGIEYVLMVGDYATVPMRICYPDPDYHVYNPSDPGLVAPGTPTDYYYADLSYPDSTSWDSDGDGYPGEYGEDDPDFLAEVAVGRIPVNDSTRITYTLDKLVAFEQDTGGWKSKVLHAGAILFFENQDYSGYPFIDGATCLDSIETALMSGMTISHQSEQAGLVTSPFPWSAISEAAFAGTWSGGEHAVVNWSGHGSPSGAGRTVWEWDDGDGVPESNGELQSYRFIGLGTSDLDDDHPSVVFAISCNVGFPEPNPYGNLGIDLLTLPDWGASAGMLSSARPAAVAGDWKATGGGTEQICYDFNRYMLVEDEKVGDALYDGKFHANTYYAWDHVYEYMNLYNYNLYGDPALDVGGATAGVAGPGEARGPILTLDRPQPNPITSVTSLKFTLSVPERVCMRIYDIRGREVAKPVAKVYSAGEHVITWEATATDGGRLASGIYFFALQAGNERAARKLVLL